MPVQATWDKSRTTRDFPPFQACFLPFQGGLFSSNMGWTKDDESSPPLKQHEMEGGFSLFRGNTEWIEDDESRSDGKFWPFRATGSSRIYGEIFHLFWCGIHHLWRSFRLFRQYGMNRGRQERTASFCLFRRHGVQGIMRRWSTFSGVVFHLFRCGAFSGDTEFNES